MAIKLNSGFEILYLSYLNDDFLEALNVARKALIDL
jgi:hypothetical protein